MNIVSTDELFGVGGAGPGPLLIHTPTNDLA